MVSITFLWHDKLTSTLLSTIYSCMIVSVKGKRERWRRRKRKSEAGTVQDMLAVYKLLDSEMFPSLKAVMQVALTIPVSSCTCERSFSALRRLHTWLRRTTGQSRLQQLWCPLRRSCLKELNTKGSLTGLPPSKCGDIDFLDFLGWPFHSFFFALDVKHVLLLIIDDLYWFMKVQIGVQPSRIEMAIRK